MAKKLTNKQKGYLAGAGALGLFLLYGGTAKASTPTPSSPKPSTGGGGSTGGAARPEGVALRVADRPEAVDRPLRPSKRATAVRPSRSGSERLHSL